MSELNNLIKQATSLKEGSKNFMEDYAKSIAGDVDNKISVIMHLECAEINDVYG